MIEKWIGKITHAEFGYGGYQEAMIGWSFRFEGQVCSIQDFWGYWANRPKYAEWTEARQTEMLGLFALRCGKILIDAKCRHLGELVGKPVEVTTVGGSLDSWRVLTEAV